jgi:hypothetical protein
MKSAGNFYNNGDIGMDEKSTVEKAISGLMLDRLGDFDPQSSIIEWAIEGRDDN